MHMTVRNTNYATYAVYDALIGVGEEAASRNGPVLRFPEPLTVTYLRPEERVNFVEARHANPYFHVFEAMWMLAGRNDVGFVADFVSRIKEYSDDSQVFNAAYGFRARKHYSIDQLLRAIDHLFCYPDSRQAVVLLMSPFDMDKETRDKACNLALQFTLRDNRLDLTVFNRSNDLIWGGVSGANVVHMPFFQEYIAAGLGVRIGRMHVFSADAHVYLENPQWEALRATVGELPRLPRDAYSRETVEPRALVTNFNEFDPELEDWFDNPLDFNANYHNTWISGTLTPMYASHRAYKEGNWDKAYEHAFRIGASDWSCACSMWLEKQRRRRDANTRS